MNMPQRSVRSALFGGGGHKTVPRLLKTLLIVAPFGWPAVSAAALGPAKPPRCQDLPPSLLTCDTSVDCIAGARFNVTCRAQAAAYPCLGSKEGFRRKFVCSYCFLLHPEEYVCETDGCSLGKMTTAKCKTLDDLLCLGSREFPKRGMCGGPGYEFQASHSWAVAVLLSLFLGGFGIDRFYLGYTGWGFFKLLSFGGFGLWTVIDFVLILVGYLTPAGNVSLG